MLRVAAGTSIEIKFPALIRAAAKTRLPRQPDIKILPPVSRIYVIPRGARIG
jgi:hypothetical protein